MHATVFTNRSSGLVSKPRYLIESAEIGKGNNEQISDRADFISKELKRLSITKTMIPKESEAPIKKPGTQDNSDANSSQQSEALASSTGCGGSVSGRSSGTRSFDDGDSNVGGIGARAPGEGGCGAAEGNIGKLASKSARPYPPQSSFCPAVQTDRDAGGDGKEHMAVMKARGTKLRCWVRLRCRVRFPSARLSQLECWRFVPPRWRGQLVALYAAYRVFHSLSR
jgi:hypothetical protein